MNNLWKMEQLCKPEQIFDLLRTAEWPLGIVVFGADSEFKNQVVEQLTTCLGDCMQYCGEIPDAEALVEALRIPQTVMVVLDTNQSCHPYAARSLAHTMKEAGALVVVGVHVKPKALPYNPLSTQGVVERRRAHNRTIDEIELHALKVFEVDILLTREEE